MNDLERSTFTKQPCYRYIRATDKLPTYAQLGDEDFSKILCPVKLFGGPCTYWIASYDPDTRTAWGVGEIQEREVGDFSMKELVDLRLRPFGLPLERDLFYKPQTIKEILA